MKLKVILSIILGIILLIGSVLALSLTIFQSYTPPLNITFYGNSNSTINLSIWKYANVTSATLNLSGQNNQSGNKSVPDSYSCSGSFPTQECFYATGYYPTPSFSNNAAAGLNDASIISNYTIFNQTTSINFNPYGIYAKDTTCCSGASYLYLEYYYLNFTDGQYKFLSYSNCNTTITNVSMNGCGAGWIGANNQFICNLTVPSSGINTNGVVSIKTIFKGFQIPPFCTSTSSYFYGNVVNYTINSATNPSLIINNTNIWQYSGEFNQTNNKTNDFSSTLNSALNNGNCLYPNGSYCSLPFIFHSDSAGILGVSDLNIQYDSKPWVNLVSPLNNSYSYTPKILTCNATDLVNLTNVTLYIWNTTGIYNNSLIQTMNNLTNVSSFSMDFTNSGVYSWNCLYMNNNSKSNFADNNFTLNVDLTNPVITMNAPTNNQYLNNGTNLDLNCTPEGINLDSLFFYGNFTGSWALNSTTSGISSGTMYNKKLNLSEGVYLWTCGANKTTGPDITLSPYGNYTFIVDTTFPSNTITSITTTIGSQSVGYNVTSSDTNLGTCKYTIYNLAGGVDGTNENIIYTCNTAGTFLVSGFATFNFTSIVTDLAGNSVTTSSLFTVSQTSGSPGGGGGGSRLVDVMNVTRQPFCDKYEPLWNKAYSNWKSNLFNWEAFKKMWFALWSYGNCVSSASIIPSDIEVSQ